MWDWLKGDGNLYRQTHQQMSSTAWERVQADELDKLRRTQRHLWGNVGAYVFISAVEYFLAIQGHSQTLRADALNNLTGIIATVLLMIGNFIARDMDDDDFMGQPLPKDSYHNGQRLQLARFHYETVFTMITGLVMVTIAISVIYTGSRSLFVRQRLAVPQPLTLVGAALAFVTMLVVWWVNRRAGRRLHNAALTASSQDSLSDALTSLGTLVAIGAALIFKAAWVDGAASVLVGLFIFVAGLKIFRMSSLNLADYFDPRVEEQYRTAIESWSSVVHVEDLKAHYNGDLVTLDVVIAVDPRMRVRDSYRLGAAIENQMRARFGIVKTNVMVVPR